MKSQNCFLMWIVSSIFLSTIALAEQNPCILKPQDFKKIKDSVHSRSSNSVYVAELLEDRCSYRAGTKFVIKENPLALGFAEYVAAALYQRILGKEAVGDTIWIQDKSIGYIATQYIDSFRFFPGRYHSRDRKQIRWEELSFFDTFTELQWKGFPVTGAEEAALASELMDDIDCEVGHNFALVKTPTDFRVTRYDFDGSLKYMERLGYSRGRDGYGKAPNYSRFFDPSSGLDTEYSPPSWAHIKSNFLPMDLTTVNNARLLDAFRKITNISPLELEELVERRTREILELQTESALKKTFNVVDEATKAQIIWVAHLTVSEKLIERLGNLKNMQQCFEFEVAVKENSVKQLTALLESQQPGVLLQLKCSSLYNEGFGRRQVPLLKMVASENQAAGILKNFLVSDSEL